MYATALVMHPDCARHDTGWGHPEHQGRLPAVINAIHKDTPALLDVMLQREAQRAHVSDLKSCHSSEMIDLIRTAAHESERMRQLIAIEADTIVSDASWDAALASAGCVLDAVSIVMNLEARSAFAASRPPGHHATPTRSMGFCLFNNVAIAARAAQSKHGLDRVMIIDWDVHHGNGTQDIFYEDASVYYLSTHLDRHYPGTGHVHERGRGAGEGTTRNVPMPHGIGPDDYHRAFSEAFEAALAEFTPDLVFMSAGFDCLDGDPLGGMRLEPRDLHSVTREIMQIGVPVIAALEGGYVPERVGAGVVNVIRALADLPPRTTDG